MDGNLMLAERVRERAREKGDSNLVRLEENVAAMNEMPETSDR